MKPICGEYSSLRNCTEVTKNKSVFLFVGLVLQAACVETTPDESYVPSKQSLTTFGPYEVRQHSDQPLTTRVRNAFDQAVSQGDGAFGAFYIRPDGGSWAVVTGRYSEHDAKRMAKIDCEIVSRQDCILYATFGPQDKPTASTIPNAHKSELAKAKRDTVSGNYLAVANNPAGYTGFGVNYTSQVEAENSAMKACAEATQSGLANEIARFRLAYESAGLLRCKIFGVYR